MRDKSKSIISASDYNLPKLQPKCILFINLEHFYYFREYIKGGKVKHFGPSRRFTFESNGVRLSAVGGMIGAPLAVMTLENVIQAGAREFFVFGTAGWIGKDDTDLSCPFSPQKGWDDTGLAADYGSQSNWVDLTTFYHGSKQPLIASYNAIFRLFPEKLAIYRSRKIDLIDMELVPLSFIAKRPGCSLQALLLISDKINLNNQRINLVKSQDYQTGLEKGMQLLKNQITL